MPFFARKSEPLPPALDEAAPGIGQGGAPPAEAQAIPPAVRKVLSMLGISVESLQEAATFLSNLARDYTDRLQRVETKLDLVLSDLAELHELNQARATIRQARAALQKDGLLLDEGSAKEGRKHGRDGLA
jgi:hypothetical protein